MPKKAEREPGEAKLVARVSTVQSSLPIRPFTAFSPLLELLLELCHRKVPSLAFTRKGHISKNIESLIKYIFGKKVHSDRLLSQHGQETKSREHIHVN